jgi:hypothetical protein
MGMVIDSSFRAFTLAACVLLGGCRSEPSLPPPSGVRGPDAPHLEARTKVDRQTGKLLREWSVLLYSDRPAQKQGVEKIYYPSGALQWSREFDHGQPKGIWRSWYEDGQPRSESFFGDPSVDTIMTWWYPGGHIQSRGPARNGVHRGVWRFYYQNGHVAEEGTFFENQRHGDWHAWSADGKVVMLRKYVKGVRVSDVPDPEYVDRGAATPAALRPGPPAAAAPVQATGKAVLPSPPIDLPHWPDDPDADERPPK